MKTQEKYDTAVTLIAFLIFGLILGTLAGKCAEKVFAGNGENLVTICHYDRNEQGSNAGPHTIEVAEAAVAHHLANHVKDEGYVGDDSLGACPESEPPAVPTSTSTPMPETETPTSEFSPTPNSTSTPPTRAPSVTSTSEPTATATVRRDTPTATSTTEARRTPRTVDTTPVLPAYTSEASSVSVTPPVVSAFPLTGHGHEDTIGTAEAILIAFMFLSSLCAVCFLILVGLRF